MSEHTYEDISLFATQLHLHALPIASEAVARKAYLSSSNLTAAMEAISVRTCQRNLYQGQVEKLRAENVRMTSERDRAVEHSKRLQEQLDKYKSYSTFLSEQISGAGSLYHKLEAEYVKLRKLIEPFLDVARMCEPLLGEDYDCVLAGQTARRACPWMYFEALLELGAGNRIDPWITG